LLFFLFSSLEDYAGERDSVVLEIEESLLVYLHRILHFD
jgi:hypothetical protein